MIVPVTTPLNTADSSDKIQKLAEEIKNCQRELDECKYQRALERYNFRDEKTVL